MVGRFRGDTAGRLLLQAPPFPAPAACWWARTTVESTLRSQTIRSLAPAWAWRAVKVCCQMPSRCQYRKREGSLLPDDALAFLAEMA